MKAFEIMEELFALSDAVDFSNTCDTCKAGNPEVEVDKIAVSMFATPDVIREVSQWGAQLLIVHEPIYYNNIDEHSDEKVENEKRKLIEECALTIYRYHDHSHHTTPDVIALGELRQFALKGRVEHTDTFDLIRIHLDDPMTPMQLAKYIEEKCDIKHLRVCGNIDVPCSVVSCMFGTPGGVFKELKSDDCEILLTGEACEWILGEYARDAAQLGYKKSLIIMGHIGSERDGMKYTADMLSDMYPEIQVKYFECDEVYSYTDSKK